MPCRRTFSRIARRSRVPSITGYELREPVAKLAGGSVDGGLPSWAKEDHKHTQQTDACPSRIPAVGFEAIEDSSPEQGEYDEDAAIGGIDATEMWIILEGWDDAIADKHQCPNEAVQPRSIVA